MAEPQVIGRYVLHGVLAAGGMATVHLGRLLGAAGFTRTVAIKRMHAQFAQDPEFANMFLDEARLAGRIRHPNVVSVIDVVATDGEMLLVMEYVQGESLSKVFRAVKTSGQKIPPPIVSAIMCDALDGLHAAHEARNEQGQLLGIVHRDVSPQNIIVGADGVARVLDFGIAKASGRAQITREGQLKGKLSYMAPEQLHGVVTVATDVHAMGIVLWEALVGTRLFAAETEGHTVTKIITGKIQPPSEAGGSPVEYDAIALKALAKDPAHRYATAREMSIALAGCARKAEAHEVAAWLQTVAKDVLDARAEAVSQVESQPSMPSIDTHVDLREPATAADTRSDLSKDAVPPKRPKRSTVMAVAGGAAVVLVFVAAVGIRAASHDAPQAPTTTTAVAVAAPQQTLVPAATTTTAAASEPTKAAPASTPNASASSTPRARATPTAAPHATTHVTPHETLPDHL